MTVILAVVLVGRVVIFLGGDGPTSERSATSPVIVAGGTLTTLATADPSLDRRLRAGIPVILGVTLARQGTSLRATADAVDDDAADPAITYVWFKDGAKLPVSARTITTQARSTYQVEVTATDGEHTSSPMRSAVFHTR